MKLGAVLLASMALIAASPNANDPPAIPSSINACGRVCIEDLFREAEYVMGCDGLKPSCLCEQDNFRYGIRDCSGQSCGAQVRGAVLDWYYKVLCAGRLKRGSSSAAATAKTVRATETAKATAVAQTANSGAGAKTTVAPKAATTNSGTLEEWGESEPIVTV